MKRIVFEYNQQSERLRSMSPEERVELLQAHVETPLMGDSPAPKSNVCNSYPSFPGYDENNPLRPTRLPTVSEAEELLQSLRDPLNEGVQDAPLIETPDTYNN